MKKIGPAKIVTTEYFCTPCRYLWRRGLCEMTTLHFCNHKDLNDKKVENKIITEYPTSGTALLTPEWCPVLARRNKR